MAKPDIKNNTEAFSWKSNLRSLAWGLLIAAMFMVISLPSMILILFGMVPTIFAWIIDKSEKKYAMFSVMGMNFSGLFPYLIDIWFKDHSTQAAINILSNLFDLLVIYGASIFGWILFMSLPPMIIIFLMAISDRRIALLKSNQNKITEEWGEDIINDYETLNTPSNNSEAEA
jgi:hypothetical protein